MIEASLSCAKKEDDHSLVRNYLENMEANNVKKDYLKLWEEKVNNFPSNETLNVYIDFPFCRSCCTYCVYKSLPYYENKKHLLDYKNAVIKLLKDFDLIFRTKTPDTIYFGGGTPSLWSNESLIEIRDSIHNYNKIKFKKTEAHPIDLTDEKISFYKTEMGINVISIGIQSFNQNANVGQKRVFIPVDKIKHAVKVCHSLGMYVNIDLVALFNGDGEENWDIFERDMKIASEEIHPDSICVNPNFKTKLSYTQQVSKLRSIISKFCVLPYQYIADRLVLSQDEQIIKKYGNNDHYLMTLEFLKYSRMGNFHSCSGPSVRSSNQNTLAFGGAGSHRIYSYTTNGNVSYLSYNFDTKSIDIS